MASQEHRIDCQLVRSEPGTWDSSRYTLLDKQGKILQNHSGHPKLHQLREESRDLGKALERIDLSALDLVCSRCNSSISERFGSTQNGDLLCWKCVEKAHNENDQRGVSLTTDPTKAVLSTSGLRHKNLCNYVVNIATGCTHGCKFCYVPSTPNIKMRQNMLEDEVGISDSQGMWGNYVLYRDDLPERLGAKLDRKRKWERTRDGRGVVMISSGTDCYQDKRAAQITRECVIELVNHNKPVRILSRSPAMVRDLDVFSRADGLVTVGSSIPCLDDDLVRAIEPGAPVPSTRLDALEKISNSGVPVYVSMSPTYPTQERKDLRNLLCEFKSRLDPDVVFHEPINPRGANFNMTIEAAREAGQMGLAEELERLKNRNNWITYSLQQLEAVKELGEELDVPVHLWPDKQLVNYLDGKIAEEMKYERERMDSPEKYPIAKSVA